MVLGLTGGETVLVVMAGVFILFALTVSMLIPRSRPSFPGDRLGLFIFVVVLLFVGMLTAVVTATGGEEHGAEATHEGTTGEPTGTETGPGETTAPAETGTTGAETGATAKAADGAEVIAAAGRPRRQRLQTGNAHGT